MFGRLRTRSGTLVAAVSANFGQFGARVVISPFVLAIAATFGVSKGSIGVVLTLLWAAFALLQFPSGVLADRVGERRVIVLALALTVVGSLLVASAPTFGLFAVAVLLLGTGSGLYFPVGTALLARTFEDHGRVLGIHSAGAPLAGLVLPVVATAAAVRYDWRVGVALGATTAALAFATVIAFVGPTPAVAPDTALRSRLHPRTALDLVSRPGVAVTTVVATLSMYVFQSFVSFFPTFLREYHGFTPGAASGAFGVAFVLIVVGLPVVGSLADRYGTTVGVAVPLLVSAVGFAVLLLSPTRAITYGGVGLVGIGVTWGGAIQSRFMSHFPADVQASGFGTVRTVFTLLGAVGNAATGILAERVGWQAAYGTLVVLLAIAAGVLAVDHGRQNE